MSCPAAKAAFPAVIDDTEMCRMWQLHWASNTVLDPLPTANARPEIPEPRAYFTNHLLSQTSPPVLVVLQ